MKRNPCIYCGAKPVKKIAAIIQCVFFKCPNCKTNITTFEYNIELAEAAWNEKNPSKAQEEKC